MIEIPIIDAAGKQVGSERLDPDLLGGRVRYSLLKQAIVAYRNNLRVGTVQTKSRADVHGASKKLYRQKGTGRARAGNLRTPVRVGGGHAFAKKNRDFSQKLNRKSRRLARDSAILAKALSGSAKILKDMVFEKPQTKKMVGLLSAAGSPQGVLVAIDAPNENLVKSGRNLPKVDIKLMGDVNAYDVLRARSLVFTPESFAALSSGLSAAKSE
ncbi:MAG: 50S ribosomal protein L4 [Phycisphaerales bacterium]|nr:50S ribosomal protein L4 [Phycisphaerales bacterium]MCB9854853.1 50S ribosomal protein L4 [Phycisphaerales bacterium]